MLYLGTKCCQSVGPLNSFFVRTAESSHVNVETVSMLKTHSFFLQQQFLFRIYMYFESIPLLSSSATLALNRRLTVSSKAEVTYSTLSHLWTGNNVAENGNR